MCSLCGRDERWSHCYTWGFTQRETWQHAIRLFNQREGGPPHGTSVAL